MTANLLNQNSTNFLLHPRKLLEKSDSSTSSQSFDGKKMINVKGKQCKITKNSKENNTVLISRIKCKNIIQKMLTNLNNIKELIERGISPPDGDEDYNRRVQRVKEFSSRFSRNYLYPIKRQLNNLDVTNHKNVVGIYQIIQQSLQAYYNHLPSSIGTCLADKIKSVLNHTIELCKIHVNLEKAPEEQEFALKLKSETLLETIEANFNKKTSEKVVNTTTVNSTIKTKSCKSKLGQNKKNNRLSMYTVSASFRNDPQWKKAVEFLAKKKFNVKSRYKTSVYKHRPPIEKPHIIALANKRKFVEKRTFSGLLINTPITTPIREDDIVTMVENNDEEEKWEDKLQKDSNNNQETDENLLMKCLQLVRDNFNNNNNTNENNRNDNITKIIYKLQEYLEENVKGDKTEVINKIIKQLDLVNSTHNIIEEADNKNTSMKSSRKEPIITVTGAKNAKLICIRDDNEIIDESDDDNDRKINELITNETKIEQTNSETQTDLQILSTKPSKKNVKISRLPKCDRKLSLLPKTSAIKIIQYKLDYHKYSKQNHMYRKSSNIIPWVLTGKISDHLLDQVMMSIVQEMESEEILENLYQSEFQY